MTAGRDRGRRAAAAGVPAARRERHLPLPLGLGAADARGVIEHRSDGAYEPRLADLAVRNLDDILADIDETRMWERALESEPIPQNLDRGRAGRRRVHRYGCVHRSQVAVVPRALDRRGRARRGGRVAHGPSSRRRHARATRRAGPRPRPGRCVERDLGEAGAPGFGQWEHVRLHPHFTERAFAQSPTLAPIGAPGGSHHERLDGSGYHRDTRGPALDQAARIFAAADCYGAMGEVRPYRQALDASAAAAEMMREVEEGAARSGSRRRGARCRRPPRAAATSRVACRADRARAGSSPRARAGRVQPGDRPGSRHLGQDRRAPRPARLPEGRRPQPGRGDTLGLRARPRSHRIRRLPMPPWRPGRTLASPSASSGGADDNRGGER